jgi:HK97 family phage major capsid protein/HK97 family phage prohead protease
MTAPTEIKAGRLARDLSNTEITLHSRAADTEPMRMSFPASSETAVDRWFGTEVLRHDDQSIRMDRLKGGAAPLLFNHNWNDPIGMVDGARVQGKRLYVDVHFFDTARAKEVAAMVEGGMRNVSIGYELYEVTEDTKRGIYTATDWGVHEVSFATIPADPSVGYGRDGDTTARLVRIKSAEGDSQTDTPTQQVQPAETTATRKESHVDQTNQAAAGENADTTQQTRGLPAQPNGTTGNQALEMERARKRGIENLCKANNIDDSTRDYWVRGGVSMEAISEDLLKIIQERGEKNPQSKAKLGMSDGETRQYSLVRALLAASENNWGNAGFELECSREISKRMNTVPDAKKFYVPFEVQARNLPIPPHLRGRRDLTVASAAGGGYLVGTENVSFIEMLRNRSVAYRMGAMRLGGLQGNVTVPKQTGAATWYWLASESTGITESQQTLGQMALSPKTGGAYTEISRQLLLQSSPDAEVMVTSDLGRVGGLGIDSAVLAGTGSSGQPTGITNTAGIGSVTGGSLDFADILEFQTDIASANVMPERGGYATTPSVASLMMQRVKFSGTASPLWEGNMWDGSMCGFPAMSSNQMAAATMLFGDWSSVVVAEWGVLEISVNPFANFQAGIIGVRAMVSMDCGLRYPAAFSLASSIT